MRKWNEVVTEIKNRMVEKEEPKTSMIGYLVDDEEDNFEFICNQHSMFGVNPDEAIMNYEDMYRCEDSNKMLHLFKITIERIESYKI